jgi:hypothetical protein
MLFCRKERLKMTHRWILIAVLICSVSVCGAGAVLPEGFVLNGTEGLARNSDPNGWAFTTDTDLIYMKTTLPAGSVLSILPSGGLEQIRSFAKKQNQTRVKIWGILTSYKKQNFLFPIQVIALSASNSKPAEPLPTKRIDPNAMDSTVSDVIPSEVMKILRSQSKIDLARMSETLDTGSGDFALIGKTGFVASGKDKLFIPDGFGRKIEHGRLPLLPCLTLEDTEKDLAKALGRHRYNISGIVTMYDGRQYLLLYRAIRTYSNGNFTP